MGRLARGFALLRLPRMPEVKKGRGLQGFQPSAVDPDSGGLGGWLIWFLIGGGAVHTVGCETKHGGNTPIPPNPHCQTVRFKDRAREKQRQASLKQQRRQREEEEAAEAAEQARVCCAHMLGAGQHLALAGAAI